MPYRDRAQVEAWLADFWDAHSLFRQKLSVLDDHFIPDQNSGLVVAHLDHTPGMAYLSVKMVDGQPRWMLTFEPRDVPLELDGGGVRELSDELAAVGALCAYLQKRTDEALQGSSTTSV